MKVIKNIIVFLKKMFGQDVSIKIDNHKKYNFIKNKKCDITINEGSIKNEK